MSAQQKFFLIIQAIASLVIIGYLVFEIISQSQKKKRKEIQEIKKILERHSKEGFTEIILTNPKTKERKVLQIPKM